MLSTDPLTRKIGRLNNSEEMEGHPFTYITTNEFRLDRTADELARKAILPVSCHIGFSGWHNFDIMSLRKSSRGVICDINPGNKKFIEQTLQVLKVSSNRFDFVNRVLPYLEDSSINFSTNVKLLEEALDVTKEEEVRGELKRTGSWLATDDSFRHIKQLAVADKIVAIRENILNTATFEKLAKILRDNDIEIDTVYLSNISGYITDDLKNAYIATANAITQMRTLVINCPHPKSNIAFIRSKFFISYSPIQFVCEGKVLQEDSTKYFDIEYED